ncbi:CPBP family intramembrane glutamic endopeptidase [Bacteroidota bacterium]
MPNIIIKPMGWKESLLFFGIPTIILYIATHICIPIVQRATGLPIIVCWFICGGLLVFAPLFIASLIFYNREGNEWNYKTLMKRFRLDKFSRKDLLISIVGVVIAFLGTFIMMEIGKKYINYFSPSPPWITVSPLQPGEYWILLAWLPLFFFNIFGEGFFWRGYIFPRQRVRFSDTTWFVHGLLWLMFHIPFGLDLMFTVIPVIFITTYLVQYTRNTWVDIIIHIAVNGTGFLLVAFGLVH